MKFIGNLERIQMVFKHYSYGDVRLNSYAFWCSGVCCERYKKLNKVNKDDSDSLNWSQWPTAGCDYYTCLIISG